MNEGIREFGALEILQRYTLRREPYCRNQHGCILHFIVFNRRDSMRPLIQGGVKPLLCHAFSQHPHLNRRVISAQPVVQLHIAAASPVGGQVDQAPAQRPGAHVGSHFAHVVFLLFAGLFEGGTCGEGTQHQAGKKNGQLTHTHQPSFHGSAFGFSKLAMNSSRMRLLSAASSALGPR